MAGAKHLHMKCAEIDVVVLSRWMSVLRINKINKTNSVLDMQLTLVDACRGPRISHKTQG